MIRFQAGWPPLVGCLLLLSHHIRSCPPFLAAVSTIHLRTHLGVVAGTFLTYRTYKTWSVFPLAPNKSKNKRSFAQLDVSFIRIIGPGWLSRYSDSLLAGRSGDQIAVVGEIFRTCPDRLWGPPTLLYNGYRVFPGSKAAGAWRCPPTPSSAEVKEIVELYLYSPSGPSWSLLGWKLRLLYFIRIIVSEE
jgi:hypothetical protein